MTTATAPRPAAPRAAQRPLSPAEQEARRHLDLMGYGPGAVELVAGTNDPARPEVINLVVWTKDTYRQGAHTRDWLESERPGALLRKAFTLAEQWGNVYISVGTYGQTPNTFKGGKLQYSRSAPLPRRCIILDDVRDLSALPLPPTWATETSPGNHQVGFTAEELLTPAQAERLAAGAAALMGSDASGSDAQQLIRLAGTLNTKPKCAGAPGNPAKGIEPEGWRVRLRAEGPRYPAATLFRTFAPFDAPGVTGSRDKPELSRPDRAPGDVGQGSELWRQAAWRNELRRAADHILPLVRTGRGGLLGDNGLPRGLTPRQPGYTILEARARGEITYQSAGGSWDASRERYNVIKSLAYIGYNRAEIAALALKLADFGVEVKGAAAIWLDIARCIWLVTLRSEDRQGRPVTPIYHPRRPEPVGDAPPVELAAMPRPRKGRPETRGARVEALGELLAARVGERVTRPQLAALMAAQGQPVGVRAIACFLGRLKASAGWRVELRALGRGGLLVERCEKSDRKSCAESVIDPSFAEAAAAHHNAETAPAAALGEHTPPDPPPCPAPGAAGDEPAAALEALPPVEPQEPGGGCAPPQAEGLPAAAPLDLDALAARIDESCSFIRAQVRTRVITRGPRAGLVEDVKPRATLAIVAELLPDVPADVLAEAWEYRKSWQRDAARFRAALPQALYAELRSVERALHLASQPAPLPWAALDAEQRDRLAARCVTRAEGDAVLAAALAEAQQRNAIRAHRAAVQRQKHNDRLARQLRAELASRKLPTTPPPVERGGAKRGKAPDRDAVRVAREEQEAACYEALDRLFGRAQAPAPAAARPRPAPPVVERAQAPALPEAPQWGDGRRETLVERLAALKAEKVVSCAD